MATSFLQRQLGWRMQQLRIKAGKTRADVALTGIISESTLSRLENGIVATHWGKIQLLCEFYGVDGATQSTLVKQAKASRVGDSWLEQYGDDVPETLAMFIGAEQAAERVRAYDPEAIPGMLQTEEYTRGLFKGEKPTSPPERIDLLVAGRMARRDQYWTRREDGALLNAVLGEAALAREVGGHATMRRQVEHLREVSDLPGTEIGILPFSVGAHPGIYGAFTIFQFPDPEDPSVIFFESYTGGQYLQDPRVVSRMSAVWQRIHNLAIPIKEYKQR